MFMFVYTWTYMNYMNFCGITNVRINIYRGFYHGIIYIVSEGRNARISKRQKYQRQLSIDFNLHNLSSSSKNVVGSNILKFITDYSNIRILRSEIIGLFVILKRRY
jgi:hypothetical protein